jgi:hypothetical protein
VKRSLLRNTPFARILPRSILGLKLLPAFSSNQWLVGWELNRKRFRHFHICFPKIANGPDLADTTAYLQPSEFMWQGERRYREY